MEVIKTKQSLQKAIDGHKAVGKKIAFIPTMGNLHNGHISLVLQGKKYAEITVVSIFINKKQFGVNEDFESYPRTIEEDIAKLKEAEVDILYLPTEVEVFSSEYELSLDIPSLTKVLCGITRPNFFGGVLSVVLKLFLQVRPDFAIFGKKDYQQLKVVTSLANSLDIGIKVIGSEIAREKNGLAMSSRNNYFTKDEKETLGFIYSTLCLIKEQIFKNKDITAAITEGKKQLLQHGITKLDYLEIRDRDDLSLKTTTASNGIIFFAGFYKNVRLIDNVEV